MNKKKLEAMAATYLRAGIAAVIALWLAGVTDPKALKEPTTASRPGCWPTTISKNSITDSASLG